MVTTTTVYGFQKPAVAGDEDAWGGYLNNNIDKYESILTGNTTITSLVITTADINGGTLDNVVIGGSTPAAITGTTITGTSLVGPLATAAQTNITSLGTLTTLTVDDITINGSTISDASTLTIDVGGNIVFDADSGEIEFKDGGTTFGNVAKSGNDFRINQAIQDGDIVFRGNDGGSIITALTLDMSEAGAATFNAGANFEGDLDIVTGTNARLTINDLIGEVGTGNVALQAQNSAGSSLKPLGFRAEDIRFATGSAERVRITDGGVGIGATSPSSYDGEADNLVVASSDHTGLTIASTGTDKRTNLYFSDGTSGSAAYIGGFSYDHSDDSLLMRTAGSERIRLLNNGDVRFSGNSHTPYIQLTNSGRVAGNPGYSFNNDTDTGMYQPSGEANTIAFSTNGTNRMKITGQGIDLQNENLTIGDNAKAQFGASNDLQIYHSTSDAASIIRDSGTGPLAIQSNLLLLQNSGGTANLLKATEGGAVELLYGNSTKCSTTANGINVAGDVVVTRDLYVSDAIIHQGDGDTYINFRGDVIDIYTGGTAVVFGSNGPYITDGSLKEDYDALSGTSVTCNVNSGGAFSLTMSGNTTFSFTAPSTGYIEGFVLQLTGNGSTVTWPSSVRWAGGSAPDAPANGETDILVFFSRDGGSNWYGVLSSDAAS